MTTTDIFVCHGTDPSLRLEEVHRPGGSKVLPWLTQPAPTGNPGENHGKLGLVSGKNHGKPMVFSGKIMENLWFFPEKWRLRFFPEQWWTTYGSFHVFFRLFQRNGWKTPGLSMSFPSEIRISMNLSEIFCSLQWKTAQSTLGLVGYWLEVELWIHVVSWGLWLAEHGKKPVRS